ncbi:MAG: ATP-binding protein, partial [Oscillospiraceae bacterium]|nr:ATP-binding protein [Oscillospiraceae bacterium]
GSFVMVFSDSGMPYDPLSAAAPDILLPAQEREIGGLGLFLVKKLMDSVTYRYEDGRNILTVEKRI